MLYLCKCLNVYFAILQKWINKRLSPLLAHRVSLPVSWASLGRLYTIGRWFQLVGFINWWSSSQSGLTSNKKCAYNLIVAVESNKLKPFTHALALGLNRRVSTEGSCKRLFLFLFPMQPYSTRKQRICMDGLEENTDIRIHPLYCRPALVKRLVKHLVHRWKQGQMYKRINPSSALGRFCF